MILAASSKSVLRGTAVHEKESVNRWKRVRILRPRKRYMIKLALKKKTKKNSKNSNMKRLLMMNQKYQRKNMSSYF